MWHNFSQLVALYLPVCLLACQSSCRRFFFGLPERILWLLAFLIPPISFPEWISVFQPHVKLLHFMTSFPFLFSCFIDVLPTWLYLLIRRTNNVQHHAIWNWNHLFIERNFSFSIPTFLLFHLFSFFSFLFTREWDEGAICFFFLLCFFVPHDVDVYVSLDNITRSSSRSDECEYCWRGDANLKWRW